MAILLEETDAKGGCKVWKVLEVLEIKSKAIVEKGNFVFSFITYRKTSKIDLLLKILKINLTK